MEWKLGEQLDDPPPRPLVLLGQELLVRDANGRALGYFYFEDGPGRRSAAKLLSKDEARRIALPELFHKPSE